MSTEGTYERLADPGDFIAAIPHLLGFHPADSLVLALIDDDETGVIATALRTDLPPPIDEADFVRQLVENVQRTPARTVHVVAVADADPEDESAEPPFEPVVSELARCLRRQGIAVGSTNWAAATSAGAPWRAYGLAEHGVVPDPGSTVFAAECAYFGLVTHASREEMEESIALQAAPEVLKARAERLDGLREDVNQPNPYLVYDAISRAHRNELHLDEDEILQIGWTLTFYDIRDNYIKYCLDKGSRAAQQVWLMLMRELPAPWRAEPGALFAACAYVQGDGPLAGVALDNILESVPAHGLSTLINGFLQSGMPPADFRGVLERCQYPSDS